MTAPLVESLSSTVDDSGFHFPYLGFTTTPNFPAVAAKVFEISLLACNSGTPAAAELAFSRSTVIKIRKYASNVDSARFAPTNAVLTH